jgi:hypothetical protein
VSGDLVLRYYRALADLPHDRASALRDLEACFRDGEAPTDLEGTTDGRLLTTTVGWGLDAIFGVLARVWMPWKGKSFDAEAKEGRNLFTDGAALPMRVLWPGYDERRPERPGRFSSFPFSIWEGRSRLAHGPDQVLMIDYARPDGPWLVRDVVDELVRIDEGLFLGQALLRWRGEHRRVAWFELRA